MFKKQHETTSGERSSMENEANEAIDVFERFNPTIEFNNQITADISNENMLKEIDNKLQINQKNYSCTAVNWAKLLNLQ